MATHSPISVPELYRTLHMYFPVVSDYVTYQLTVYECVRCDRAITYFNDLFNQ